MRLHWEGVQRLKFGSHRVELAAAEKVARAGHAHSHRGARVDLRAFGGSALTAAVAVPKESAEAALVIDVAADAPPGRHACTLVAKCQWNGEELFARRALILEITP